MTPVLAQVRFGFQGIIMKYGREALARKKKVELDYPIPPFCVE
jgi:hypothetical protein